MLGLHFSRNAGTAARPTCCKVLLLYPDFLAFCNVSSTSVDLAGGLFSVCIVVTQNACEIAGTASSEAHFRPAPWSQFRGLTLLVPLNITHGLQNFVTRASSSLKLALNTRPSLPAPPATRRGRAFHRRCLKTNPLRRRSVACKHALTFSGHHPCIFIKNVTTKQYHPDDRASKEILILITFDSLARFVPRADEAHTLHWTTKVNPLA